MLEMELPQTLQAVGADPTAEIAVMGPEGAVNVLYRRELQAAEDPAALRAKLVSDFREKLANPFIAASRGFIDEVIHQGYSYDVMVWTKPNPTPQSKISFYLFIFFNIL
mgnify:CR=1 FL=1